VLQLSYFVIHCFIELLLLYCIPDNMNELYLHFSDKYDVMPIGSIGVLDGQTVTMI
jgi:hypothetical protein